MSEPEAHVSGVGLFPIELEFSSVDFSGEMNMLVRLYVR